MKIRLLLLFLLAFIGSDLFAQDNMTITVKAGTTIKESVPAVDLYEYPEFTQGTVVTRGGKSSTTAINYNRFLDQIQFITAKGDTLTLINQQNVAFINIANDTFFYDKGYIKLVSSAGDIKLGIKQTLSVVDKEKLGGYGVTSSTTAIDSYSSYNDGAKDFGLTVMQDVILAKKVQYYVGDNYNHFVLANKKNLIKFFPRKEHEISRFLKENAVVFNNREDLEKLVQFLAKL